MTTHLGIVMDPIHTIQTHKDSTLALMLEAQSRGMTLYYMEPKHLFNEKGQAFARAAQIKVFEDDKNWFELADFETMALKQLDCILMRKDPPFDMGYVYATYMLEQAEREGVLVINKPQSLRDCNEKFYTTWFPEHAPATCVATERQTLLQFLNTHEDCVIKPLHGMAGQGVFRLKAGDANTNVIIEAVTQNSQMPAMIQQYLPAIKDGDKRILVFNGEPVDHVVARMPASDDFRGNIAAGAKVVVRPIESYERELAQTLGKTLVEKGLYFVGLDVIGDKITEINVTSPTCLKHIQDVTDEKVCGKVVDMVQALVSS